MKYICENYDTYFCLDIIMAVVVTVRDLENGVRAHGDLELVVFLRNLNILVEKGHKRKNPYFFNSG